MPKGRAKCGLVEALVFLAALTCGTGCSLTSKVLLDLEAVGEDGESYAFSKPIFQTFAMFIAMLAALPFHYLVSHFKIPFPGYTHKAKKAQKNEGSFLTETRPTNFGSFPTEEEDDDDDTPEYQPLTREMFFVLLLPALFDFGATAFCMFGLQYINVSSYQLLRGSSIVFVALIKSFWLGDHLKRYMWLGVGWNLVSIVLVGATTFFESSDPTVQDTGNSEPLLGVSLILAGALVQSLQYTFEEHAMSSIAVAPMLLVGMEGFWGTLICILFVYPLAYYLPGTDEGSFENPHNTMFMIRTNPHLQVMIALYVFFIFFYNLMCVILTRLLDSVWHAILDNFRPITVWIAGLVTFYINPNYGETWTSWSFLQLAAMICLLYGTGIYSAPDAGSIMLIGRPQDCFIDCTAEYEEEQAHPHPHQPLTSSPFLSSGAPRRGSQDIPKFHLDTREPENKGSSRSKAVYRRNSE